MRADRFTLSATASAMALVAAIGVGAIVPTAAAIAETAAQDAPAVEVADIIRDATDLPGPIDYDTSRHVKVSLETVEVVGQLADGTTYRYWTFNEKVPGPFVRVRVGDTVEVMLENDETSWMMHNVDFHAVTGPGGGAPATLAEPGHSGTFTFKALNPGLYVYHCATPMVAQHIANGMYGMILVEPEEGLPAVDREFYVMQGEIYTEEPIGTQGELFESYDKLLNEMPEYYVFNGAANALTGDRALRAEVGETVRVFFGVGGPNKTSSFHAIGEIFDTVYPLGSATSQLLHDVQTVTVAPGGATAVEMTLQVPGTYILVDHALSRAERGLAAQMIVDGPANPEVFAAPHMPAMSNHQPRPGPGSVRPGRPSPDLPPVLLVVFGTVDIAMTAHALELPDRTRPPAVFGYGFRPFFLLAAMSAVLFVAIWLVVLHHGGWPDGRVAAMTWHAHEMLFGFVGAAVGGFLLTAIPNWTGVRAVTGWPLVGLVALWVAGRVASWPFAEPSVATAAIDLAFFPVLGATVAVPLIRAGKIRNTAFLLLLTLLATANLLFHLEWLGATVDTIGAGIALATGVVLMMVTVVGGRIVPSFTQSAQLRTRPDLGIVPLPWLGRLALVSTAAMIPVDLIWPEGQAAGTVALVAAVAHAARLARWRGRYTLGQPILWVLHLGYAWIVAALMLKAATFLGGVALGSAWLHALTAGAFSTMMLAIMSRASLGHTGRQIVAAPPTVAAYALLALAGIARVAAPMLPGELYLALLGVSGALWSGAFLLFLWVYTPILTRPRVDGLPG